MMNITISPAQPEHYATLCAIELSAFETLRAAGAVSGTATATSLDGLRDYAREGVLLAAFTPKAIPVGFAAGQYEDGWLHIAEIDVHPEWQRQGIGKRLMQALLREGRQRGVTGATLTTDSMAAFNARFYASLDFDITQEDSTPPHLLRHIANEVAAGFDPARRVAMLVKF